ncbi:DUF4350 domain-containing protein [Salinibacterium sp. ZJ454]|uniref:DUF4350 domain-containing protein n=1 Tax=Salinibacterium sp. ZJ454 TaxID=2708339 RepID=UPI00141F9C83|nr:DUF4350 domain-containing protein [Salinibacterium sp. ZJ454]
MTVTTPTVRAAGRKSLFWVLAALFAVLVGVIVFALVGSSAGGDPLSPTNAAPEGSRALAEVLRDQGVDVVPTVSLDQTRKEATSAGLEDTTIVLFDPSGFLTEDQLRQTTGLATHLIVIDPDFGQLNALAPAVEAAGNVSGVLDADCGVRAVDNASSVTGEGSGYRLTDPSADAVACLGSGDDVYSLIQLPADAAEASVTVLGTTTALRNETVALEGNAALALTLFGGTDTLIWYLPSIADVENAALTPEELMPPWTVGIPFALLAVGLAAALWRGRRFGPLVVENLPVTVRASETTEGRARLYEKNSARLRALDSLRLGAVQRLAAHVGLSRSATVDEILAATAAATGWPLPTVRAILLDAQPGSDADLMTLSDDLTRLETTAARASRPTSEQKE